MKTILWEVIRKLAFQPKLNLEGFWRWDNLFQYIMAPPPCDRWSMKRSVFLVQMAEYQYLKIFVTFYCLRFKYFKIFQNVSKNVKIFQTFQAFSLCRRPSINIWRFSLARCILLFANSGLSQSWDNQVCCLFVFACCTSGHLFWWYNILIKKGILKSIKIGKKNRTCLRLLQSTFRENTKRNSRNVVCA